jgi:FAD/FMN-containing dehydrogenase
VLSTADDESRALAPEAQSAAEEINRLRGELRSLVLADGHRDEREKVDTFDAAWADFEDVDTRLLALAIRNTNVKAARLAEEEGAAALDRFVSALTAMQKGTSDPNAIRQLASASVAAVRAQSLLLVHIPTAGDAAMTRLEQRIRELNETVEGALTGARGSAHVSPDQLATAARAWRDYQRTAVEVLRLSRENANVISFDVSIHEKRHATKDCLAALSALLAAIEAGPHATR